MNDPLRAKDRHAPPRAEPMQPDNPGKGEDAEAPADAEAARESKSVDRALEQASTALGNVRDV